MNVVSCWFFGVVFMGFFSGYVLILIGVWWPVLVVLMGGSGFGLMSSDDAKNHQYEFLVDMDGQRHWLCLETNLLVLFFSSFIAFGAALLSLSIQMDEAVGFVQRQTCNKL